MLKKLVGIVFVITGLAFMVRGERRRTSTVPDGIPQRLPPIEFGHTPPQFLCWHCHETSIVPDDLDFGQHIVSCGHCNMDNELKLKVTDHNQTFMGAMPVVNRVANYFQN